MAKRKDSEFRRFVNDKYMEHRDECAWFMIKCKYFGLDDYFKANKNFLRKLYKEQSLWNTSTRP